MRRMKRARRGWRRSRQLGHGDGDGDVPPPLPTSSPSAAPSLLGEGELRDLSTHVPVFQLALYFFFFLRTVSAL
ncbi:hypothetical protein SORBI_3006G076100 [Sorghum bicolor]|uniref:Uncharacterized protein n=1 Tax=Sorghum bicolor TaxID=4558 RepID=A0A1B6PKU5_SORBI|nr:hypothetical protein SORBI_3006G076100 [Sorghum bicolor]